MSPETDLAALRADLADFDAYLKSDTLFWTLSANLPALSIGGLQFARRRLSVLRDSLSSAQQAEYDSLETQAAQLFNRWPVNIEKKALKEIHSRLNVWASALDELSENYSAAIMPRVYLALLFSLVERQPEAAALQNRLALLDSRLRPKLAPSGFIWDQALTPAFPADPFWFLYRRPAAGNKA